MKKIKLLALFAFLFLFLPHSAKAQVPSFDCSKSIQVYTDVTTGNVYSCKITAGVGTWMLAGGGGGAFGPNFVAGGGTAQAQTVAPTTAVTDVTLVNGYQICWTPNAANISTAPTLAGGGTSTFSAKPITKYPGAGALVANDINPPAIACVIYDGTEFQLLDPQTGFIVGAIPRPQTTTSDTITGSDRANGVIENNAGAIAVAIGQAGVAPFDRNFFFFIKDIGVGASTITPSGGSQISGNNGVLGATLVVPSGQTAWCYSDNTNYQCSLAGIVTPTYPVTVANGVSGANPCFTSTTVESAGNLLPLNTLVKGGGSGACTSGSSITDNAATVSTTELISVGANAPSITVRGTAGGLACFEGTPYTNVAVAAGLYCDGTAHEIMAVTAGASTASPGMMVRRMPNPAHQTAKTATITTTTLCDSVAGACNQSGNYTIEWAFTQVGTACGTPGAGGVTFTLAWTDQNGVAHAATGMAMDDSASLVATTGTFHFTTSNATAWASGQFNLSSNGAAPIQYATVYTACGVGTGSYQLDAWATRKE